MHIAVVGAGALGLVYGGLLAARTKTSVTFVVRPSKAGPAATVRLERIDGSEDVDKIPAQTREGRVPESADVALICVRAEQLDEALFSALDGSRASIVVLTPMFDEDLARLTERLGRRVYAAMPSVVAYVDAAHSNGGTTVRYWLPRVASTLVEEPRPMRAEVDELVRAFREAGIQARLELGVEETNASTTVSFIPLAMAIDVAGSVDGVMDDRALLRLAIDAAKEGAELSHALGKPAAWAPLLTKFLGPITARVGVSVAKRRAPEAVHYVEEHFGRKLHAQNVAMAERMVRLADQKRVAHAALTELHARLVAVR